MSQNLRAWPSLALGTISCSHTATEHEVSETGKTQCDVRRGCFEQGMSSLTTLVVLERPNDCVGARGMVALQTPRQAPEKDANGAGLLWKIWLQIIPEFAA